MNTNRSLPLVSVLICTYNAEETIKETLLSCIHQTYQNCEILIHDDKSTDNTITVIEEVWDQRIQVIASWKKLWPYGGLNFLLDHAKGKYIAIQDHDDLREAEKIEKQITVLENHPEYIATGTKTCMWYEGDSYYFDYYLGEETYYTLHPSLVFRNGKARYPTDRTYMADAYFQKIALCQWKKLIYNIDETLTIHRIKQWSENYSYKWFQFNKATIRTLFELHPFWYAFFALSWEMMRKIVYPILQKIKKGHWIDPIERVPFRLQGYRIFLFD